MLNKKVLKKGGISVLLVVVVLVLVVLVNVAATALSSRYPFSVDLTANNDYTINLDDDYKTFIENIQYPVEIIVCAEKEDFFNDVYGVQMVNTLYLIDANLSSTTIQDLTRKYAAQANYFIESFPTINRNITVSYHNPNSATAFASVSNEFPNEDLSYGDIIISCKHTTAEGIEIKRHRILSISDIFKTQSEGSSAYSSYYSNSITGSTIATEITSALYIITSDKSVKATVIGGHEQSKYYDYSALQTLLKKNNYEFTPEIQLKSAAIPKETELVVIAAPTTDFDKSELDKLDEFLKDDGNYGKNLLYLPSIYQPELPNLEDFLYEWGIEVLNEISYDETSYWASQGYPQFTIPESGTSDYTVEADKREATYFSSCFRLMRRSFENKMTRSTQSVIVTSESVVGLPTDAQSDWKASQAQNKGPFDVFIIGSNYAEKGESTTDKSNVIAISGDYFMASEALNSASYKNSAVVLSVINDICNQNVQNSINISERTINDVNFGDEIINTVAPTVIGVLFIGVLPILFIATGIFVAIKRKRK